MSKPLNRHIRKTTHIQTIEMGMGTLIGVGLIVLTGLGIIIHAMMGLLFGRR